MLPFDEEYNKIIRDIHIDEQNLPTILSNPNFIDYINQTKTPLHDMMRRSFLAHDRNIFEESHQNVQAQPPIILTIYSKMLRIFLNHGCDINKQDAQGNTVLHWICNNNLELGFYTLLNYEHDGRPKTAIQKPNVQIKNANGHTALMCACQRGYANMTRLLLVNFFDNFSAEDMAIAKQHITNTAHMQHLLPLFEQNSVNLFGEPASRSQVGLPSMEQYFRNRGEENQLAIKRYTAYRNTQNLAKAAPVPANQPATSSFKPTSSDPKLIEESPGMDNQIAKKAIQHTKKTKEKPLKRLQKPLGKSSLSKEVRTQDIESTDESEASTSSSEQNSSSTPSRSPSPSPFNPFNFTD